MTYATDHSQIRKETEIAWAAGFFDGDGHVRTDLQTPTTAGRRPYFTMKIQITQTQREPLDRLAAAVGYGRVRGPYGPYRPGTSAVFTYTVTSAAEVSEVMDLLLPYLSGPKRNQWAEAHGRYIELNNQSRQDLPADARGGW